MVKNTQVEESTCPPRPFASGSLPGWQALQGDPSTLLGVIPYAHITPRTIEGSCVAGGLVQVREGHAPIGQGNYDRSVLSPGLRVWKGV